MERQRIARVAALLAAGLMVAGAGAARAQSADQPGGATSEQGPTLGTTDEPTAEDIEQAKQAFLDGQAAFQAKDYDLAVAKFKAAYRLSKNPLLLYNIGFTLDRKQERDLALFYYRKFLDDAGPQARVYDEVAARVEAIEEAQEAQAVFDTGSMGAPAGEAGAQPGARVSELMHQAVEEAPPGEPLDITAVVPEGSGWQVTLYYRAAGEARFASTLMRPRYNELVGRIPAAKTTGKFVQYYLEVRDESGRLETRSGRAVSPHLVLIEAGARPRFYPDVGPEVGPDIGPDVGPDAGPDIGPEVGSDIGRGAAEGEPGDAPAGSPAGASDDDSTRRRYMKWGTTGATVSMLALWLVLDRSAANMALSLEREVEYSNTKDDCPSGSPCRSFSQFQQDLETRGHRYEVMANVSLALGVVSAGVAGYLWYRELGGQAPARSAAGQERAGRVTAVPMLGREVVGAAARLRF